MSKSSEVTIVVSDPVKMSDKFGQTFIRLIYCFMNVVTITDQTIVAVIKSRQIQIELGFLVGVSPSCDDIVILHG